MKLSPVAEKRPANTRYGNPTNLRTKNGIIQKIAVNRPPSEYTRRPVYPIVDKTGRKRPR